MTSFWLYRIPGWRPRKERQCISEEKHGGCNEAFVDLIEFSVKHDCDLINFVFEGEDL